MRIELREVDSENGEVTVKGTLNRKEVEYIMQFGINMLMAHGANFDLEKEDEDEVRIKFSGNSPVQ